MKIIIIYGPPATGKLTIAEKLTKKIRYKIFDNHQTMDFLHAIVLDKTQAFEPKVSKEFFWLYRKVKLDMLKTACKLKDVKGIIITEAYTGKKRFLSSMIQTAEKNKCKVYLIKLSCNIKQLEKRVYSKSRKKYRKVKSKKGLQDWFKRMKDKANLVYPYKNTLVLDTSNLSVDASSNKILKFVK